MTKFLMAAAIAGVAGLFVATLPASAQSGRCPGAVNCPANTCGPDGSTRICSGNASVCQKRPICSSGVRPYGQ
jgi:hypothetical protein